ncbi:10585_t:CDS:2, partial [Acaulospora colombiana]
RGNRESEKFDDLQLIWAQYSFTELTLKRNKWDSTIWDRLILETLFTSWTAMDLLDYDEGSECDLFSDFCETLGLEDVFENEEEMNQQITFDDEERLIESLLPNHGITIYSPQKHQDLPTLGNLKWNLSSDRLGEFSAALVYCNKKRDLYLLENNIELPETQEIPIEWIKFISNNANSE